MSKTKNVIVEVNPIVLTDTETGTVYTLEFNRASVMFAESQGFSVNAIGDLGNFPISKVAELFFYSFRMHHFGMDKKKTDTILFDKMGGVTTQFVERLIQLYIKPYNAFISEGGNSKNSVMTVQL